ncbi:MAG TPA: hypothetical protein VNX68_04020, partial [Nitrosopumilaceae archaeon]|nr:hypothetical protein [Nitrosopumilaceae archaeon]
MKFEQFKNEHMPHFELCADLVKYNCIRPVLNGPKMVFMLHAPVEAPSYLRRLLKKLEETSELATAEIYVYSQIVKHGPKVFKPTQVQFEMLEQMTLNIECGDYVQPFDTVVIELPENYCKQRIVDLPQSGETILGDMMPEQHEPNIVCIHHNKELNIILTVINFSSMLSVKQIMVMRPEDTIEDYINQVINMRNLKSSLDMSAAENELQTSILRSTL